MYIEYHIPAARGQAKQWGNSAEFTGMKRFSHCKILPMSLLASQWELTDGGHVGGRAGRPAGLNAKDWPACHLERLRGCREGWLE